MQRAHESLQRRKSRFVAEFVTQANFLPAHRQKEGWQTEIGWFEAHNGVVDRAAQEAAAVMIRQEGFELEPDQTSTIVIHDRQFLGREYQYWLKTPSGRSLYARTPISVDLEIGTPVRLSVLDAAVQIFPNAG